MKSQNLNKIGPNLNTGMFLHRGGEMSSGHCWPQCEESLGLGIQNPGTEALPAKIWPKYEFFAGKKNIENVAVEGLQAPVSVRRFPDLPDTAPKVGNRKETPQCL